MIDHSPNLEQFDAAMQEPSVAAPTGWSVEAARLGGPAIGAIGSLYEFSGGEWQNGMIIGLGGIAIGIGGTLAQRNHARRNLKVHTD